ncbi:MAG: glycogen/starch/alpha-glucan phosphorylase, partial [Candidatus Xenobia bacterium]
MKTNGNHQYHGDGAGIKHHGKHPALHQKHLRRTERAVMVEDERVAMTAEALRKDLIGNLHCMIGKDESLATPHDWYLALAYTVRDRLIDHWIKTQKTYHAKDVKRICYLSAEFLLGKHLGNALVNTGLYETAHQVMAGFGVDLDDLREQEAEPGLGNGGLGRLAACFLDSLASLELPAIGYGIRYEFGIFEQDIRDGFQVERPDKWLRFGNPWEIERPEYMVEVKFGGNTEQYQDEHGHNRVRWNPYATVIATPYDTPIPGCGNNTTNTLRLWSARASEEFNFQVFDAGDYSRAVADKTFSENISKVLYPNDNTPQGRELRLQQQYFFVSASIQDMVRRYKKDHDTFELFPEKVAIQLNDTHPSVGVAELMRLLVDEYEVDWEKAWSITTRTFAYTNHTLLSEALERWPVSLFGRLLPRHLEVIYEINRRFLEEVRKKFPADEARVSRMSLIEEGPEKYVRMAHLACVGSHSVNGVAELHTELLKQDVMHDFFELWPEKFNNKTNGVTPRRWVLLSNPKMAQLVTKKIGRTWIKNFDDMRKLEGFLKDAEFVKAWGKARLDNKRDLAEYISHHNGVEVNADSLFDVQVKRIHEYKRQLLNVLHVITLYQRIQRDPNYQMVPRTVIFGGKAAPGYYQAKLIIKLINAVAEVVNRDPDVRDRLKVVFLSNFSVSLGQRVYPAADLSEQISTAGKEASGTGNMKFSMNGALTIGTLDGANIEIREEVGEASFFLFGLTAQQVAELKANGYNPWEYYNNDAELKACIDALGSGMFGDPNLFRPIIDSLLTRDEYLLLA